MRFSIIALTVCMLCSISWRATMAAPSLTIQPVVITAQAIAEEPLLSSSASFNVVASIEAGDELIAVAMRLSLASGEFYNHSLGTDTLPFPSLISLFPALAYDTHVHSGIGVQTPIIEGFTGIGSGSVGIGNSFDARWRPISPIPGPGSFNMGRITIPNASIGVVAETSIFTTAHPTGISALIPVVPEPTAPAAFLAAGAAGLAARRQAMR